MVPGKNTAGTGLSNFIFLSLDVEVLSAPAHHRFQPSKGMTPVPGEDFPHLLNPLEPTTEVVYIALSAEARLSEETDLEKTVCGAVTARFV